MALVVLLIFDVILQAASLNWLYWDAQNNSALTSMAIFYFPLALAIVHLLLAVGYLLVLKRRGSQISNRFVGWASATATLVVVMCALLEAIA